MTSGSDAEQRIAVLVADYFDGERTVQSAVTAAWREATEAAAKKCEEAGAENHNAFGKYCAMYIRTNQP